MPPSLLSCLLPPLVPHCFYPLCLCLSSTDKTDPRACRAASSKLVQLFLLFTFFALLHSFLLRTVWAQPYFRFCWKGLMFPVDTNTNTLWKSFKLYFIAYKCFSRNSVTKKKKKKPAIWSKILISAPLWSDKYKLFSVSVEVTWCCFSAAKPLSGQ